MSARTDLGENAVETAVLALCRTFGEDALMALRFLYYVKAISAVPDHVYDRAEAEFRDREDTDLFCTPLNNPGSDKAEHYSGRARALAFYIAMCIYDQEKGTLPETR